MFGTTTKIIRHVITFKQKQTPWKMRWVIQENISGIKNTRKRDGYRERRKINDGDSYHFVKSNSTQMGLKLKKLKA